MPTPRSRTGGPLSSSRLPLTRPVRTPTGSAYSSSPWVSSSRYRYGSDGCQGRANGTASCPAGPVARATTAPSASRSTAVVVTEVASAVGEVFGADAIDGLGGFGGAPAAWGW